MNINCRALILGISLFALSTSSVKSNGVRSQSSVIKQKNIPLAGEEVDLQCSSRLSVRTNSFLQKLAQKRLKIGLNDGTIYLIEFDSNDLDIVTAQLISMEHNILLKIWNYMTVLIN